MPEFAEVHQQVAWLRPRVVGWKVAKAGYTGGHFPAWKDDPARKTKVASFFEGATLESVTQRGKHVVLGFSSGTVTSHLMFAGRWTIVGDEYRSNYKHHKDAPDPKANSFWLENEAGTRLCFNDPDFRGKVQAFPGKTVAQCEDLAGLGPDILQTAMSDPAFATPWRVEDFAAGVGKSRTAIKAFLLEQEKQAGIGNMYACEALYRAGIAPTRPSKELSRDEVVALHGAVQAIVTEAIASELDYSNVLAVYRKEKDAAGNAVKVDKVGGRDTYWVPAVQR